MVVCFSKLTIIGLYHFTLKVLKVLFQLSDFMCYTKTSYCLA